MQGADIGMGEFSVLVIGSQAGCAEVSQALREQGVMAERALSAGEAKEMLSLHNYDLILVSVDDPAVEWKGLVARGLLHAGRPFLAVAAEPDSDLIVESVRLGAVNFSTLDQAVHKALLILGSREADARGQDSFMGMIGKSPEMKRVFSLIERVAAADSTVLVTGESGTGKELVARAIHLMSPRRTAPFVPVNCGAIPGELLESELFGHEKGAFTNAIRTRPGRFELANGGTVFLDEIGEMSPVLQVKLLRILQEREFERVGGTKTITVDIRVVAATNIDIEKAVEEGRFREDLFYRLNVIPIRMPPLRERREDIPLLLEYFLKRFKDKKGWGVDGIEPRAEEALMAYHWPGNVRELENLVERMAVLAQGPVITWDDLPERIRKTAADGAAGSGSEGVAADEGGLAMPVLPEDGLCLSEAVERFERALILQALERTNWVKNRAAKLLKMNRTTLIEKLKKQGLMQPPARGKD